MNQPFLHVFDLEASEFSRKTANLFFKGEGQDIDLLQEFVRVSADPQLLQRHALFEAHKRSQLLQIYGTGLTPAGDEGWIKPYLSQMRRWDTRKRSAFVGLYDESSWAANPIRRLVDVAAERGVAQEAERVHAFYQALAGSIERHGQATLAGHNIFRYDLWRLEYATHQHESLKQWRGWLATQYQAGRLGFRDTALEVLEQAMAHARVDANFALNHFNARSLAQAYRTGGYNLENVLKALGIGTQGPAHFAHVDTAGTVRVAEALSRGLTGEELRRIFPGLPGAAQRAQVAAKTVVQEVAPTAETFLSRLKVAAAWTPEDTKILTRGGLAVAGVTALGVAAWLAYGKRRDRQTQLTGLPDEGLAAQVRHKMTAFGSGWRGLDVQLESEQAYSPTLRILGAGFVGGVAYAAHRHMLAVNPAYGKKLYDWARTFEERSPYQIGRTFGLSERAFAYQSDPVYRFGKAHLTTDGTTLSALGETFQRQLGIDIRREVEAGRDLVFERRPDEVLHTLTSHPELQARTRMVPAHGRLANAAALLDRDLFVPPLQGSTDPNALKRAWATFKEFRTSQQVRDLLPKTPRFADVKAQPFYTKLGPRSVEAGLPDLLEQARAFGRNIWSRGRVEALEAFVRPQKLFAEIGVGLRAGSWNSASSLVRGMLLKRVLPIAAGWTALKYLDYRLHHVPSNALIDAPLKANVLRADLTDGVPGARGITDFYARVVPGPQYGPLALPLMGAFAGGLWHYQKVLRGVFDGADDVRKASARLIPQLVEKSRAANFQAIAKKLGSVEGIRDLWKTHLGAPGKGALVGLAAMLPFVPGMLGSRKTGGELRDIYSGQEMVPVRAGRWWELGSTAYEGGRIKAWRPHKSVLLKARAELKALYGTEEAYWRHNAAMHPLRWLRDPYWLEKQHYQDRPYPVASPAFSDVPLIGPLLAATIGKIFKPPVRMHEEDWSGEDYSLYSTRLEPKGPGAVPPPLPKDEFGLGRALKQEAGIFAEYTGLYGFVAQSGYNALLPNYDKGRQTFFQGSRQMTSFSRRYYEQELGAGVAPSMSMREHFGYTEPFRRFVQREDFTPQANEIPNQMPSWLPGDDYFINFRVGDPYVKVDEGYARLPGPGYEALHPELEDLNPETYPDIYKLSILADVAPYSREFNTYKQIVGKQAAGDTELRIEYERILDQVRRTKDSIVRMDTRRFTAPIEEIEGTVAAVSPGGFALEEYPGRTFQFSSIGMSAADMTARILGEHNDLTRAEAAQIVDRRRLELTDYLTKTLLGQSVQLTVPKGATENTETIAAVVEVDGDNLNQELIERGYARYREDRGGPEARAMHGLLGRSVGALAENLAFEGDEGVLNPRRFVPSPAHTKIWQERTPLAQYIAQEVAGTRMRRWHRPIHDFLAPYLRGAAYRMTGQAIMPGQVQFQRDLNTLADTLEYLRGKVDPAYTSQSQRTSVGANLFASPIFVASTLPDREVHYFRAFLNESDTDKRAEILAAASPEMRRALQAQWAMQQARIAQAEGRRVEPAGEGGRVFTEEEVDDYERAETKLGYGDYLRSKEIADFFSRTGFTLPEDSDSPVWDEALDYEDVKLKIVQQEGYDAHDFNLFDDRSALLWRKPYVDGAVRELTSGRKRSPEQLRQAVEQMMVAARNRNADIRTVVQSSRRSQANVRVDVEVDEQEALLRDMRRNPEKYDVQ